MKKHVLIFVAVLMAVAITMPAFAAVEFKYGGEFKWRITSQDNVFDGTDKKGYFGTGYNSNDNRNALDQRLRLYFTFVGSPNLKVVTKLEFGTATWGMGGAFTNPGRVGVNMGANEGADSISVEVKNAYIEFNIPNTPSTAIIGVQTANLLDSWIVNDDLPAAILVTKLDPFKISLGYVAGQYGWERNQTANSNTAFVNPAYSQLPATNATYNVDDVFAAVDFAQGPFKATLVGFYQNGHDSTVSVDPGTLNTPVSTITGATLGNFFANNFMAGNPVTGTNNFSNDNLYRLRNNNLFDLGFNLTYKLDWLLAYVSFVKNLGGADLVNSFNNATVVSMDYTGFMVDAGVTYFCGPWSVNVGGFYTSGPDISSAVGANGGASTSGTQNMPFNGLSSTNVNWFTFPLATSKYFSEIMGGGVLGDDWADGAYTQVRGYKNNVAAVSSASGGSNIGSATGLSSMYWRGYPFPTNLWTITVGGSYQVTPTTKLSGSYWYFGTAGEVPVAFADSNANNYKMSSSIGHELDFYVDQQIVDGLTLTLVGAYLFANDAFCPLPFFGTTTQAREAITSTGGANSMYLNAQAQDAYKLGARLLWSF